MVENCGLEMLGFRTWCSNIYGDWVGHKGFLVNKYIEQEQPNTDLN